MDERSHFNKLAPAIDQQIDLLQTLGFHILDRDYVAHCLSMVSYHRLSAYCKASQKLRAGQTLLFDDPWTLYVFDRELRLLISDALERIEVAFRTALSNEMSVLYGPHWYTQAHLFKNPKTHAESLRKIKKLIFPHKSRHCFTQKFWITIQTQKVFDSQWQNDGGSGYSTFQYIQKYAA